MTAITTAATTTTAMTDATIAISADPMGRLLIDHRPSTEGLRSTGRSPLLSSCGTAAGDIRAEPLAQRQNDDYVSVIEFRPNDLASPLTARLTDDPPPKTSRISLLRS